MGLPDGCDAQSRLTGAWGSTSPVNLDGVVSWDASMLARNGMARAIAGLGAPMLDLSCG